MPSAEPAPRETVGSLLRMTRASHGVDLPHVAGVLRIRLVFLQAIEDGRNQDLPGPTYAVGFVRAYAEYLGLDSEEIVRRYKAETSIVPRKADLEFPTPVNEGGIPTGAMLLIAALLGAGIYGGWYWMSSQDRTVAELIQEVPERFNDLLAAAPEAGEEGAAVVEALAQSADHILSGEPAPAPTPADKPVAAVPPPETAAVQPAPVVEPPPAVTESAPQPAPAPSQPEQTAAAAPPAAPEATAPVQAQPAMPAQVERVPEERQVAVAPSSEPTVPPPPTVDEAPTEPEPAAAPQPAPVSEPEAAETSEPEPTADEQQLAAVPAAPDLPEPVTALNGAVYGAPAGSTRVVLAATQDSWIQVRAGDELIATRLLREGERFQVPDRRGLTLMVGNAGGLRIIVDGQALPSLGGAGEVRRGIRLAPDALLSN